MNSERQREMIQRDLRERAEEEHIEAQHWTQLTTGVSLASTGFFAAGNETTAVGLLCIAGATAIPAVMAEFQARKHTEEVRSDVHEPLREHTTRKGQIDYNH